MMGNALRLMDSLTTGAPRTTGRAIGAGVQMGSLLSCFSTGVGSETSNSN